MVNLIYYSVLANEARSIAVPHKKSALSALLISVLTTDLQTISQGHVSLIVVLAHVIQQPPSLAHQSQQPPPRRCVPAVRLQMGSELFDAVG